MPIHLFNLNINVRLSVIYATWEKDVKRIMRKLKDEQQKETRTKKKKEGNGDGGESEWIKLWNYYCFNNNFMQLKHASISQFYEYFKAAVVAAAASATTTTDCLPSPCKFLYSFRCALLRCNEIWYALIVIHSFTLFYIRS